MSRIGTHAKKKPRRLTFAEKRAQIKLPYKAEHITEEELKEGVRRLNARNAKPA